MTRHRLCLAAILVATALAGAAIARPSPPPMWDNLVRVDTKKFDAAYILPGADFRPYTRVIIDAPEVAFHKDFQRDYNNTTRDLSGRITDGEMREAMERVRTGFSEVFTEAYTAAGYQIATAPAADTLRVKTAVINIDVNAPDQMTAGRSRTFSEQAGSAVLVLEVHDSVTNEILGRVADGRVAGNVGRMWIRNRGTNRADFRRLFKQWAEASANGLTTLKGMSPYNGGPVR
ncbi:MAG TPA: DUF3313 family protein [Thermomonas sp.]|nr:DUF3313 family protein [Thermomonas sp.]